MAVLKQAATPDFVPLNESEPLPPTVGRRPLNLHRKFAASLSAAPDPNNICGRALAGARTTERYPT